jgi:putative nucleotidyltransferase with HDIG domain
VSERVLQWAIRFVPPALQSLAMQSATHQLLSFILMVAGVMAVVLTVRPEFLQRASDGQYFSLVGLILVVGTLASFVAAFLRQFETTVVSSVRHLYLLSAVVIGTFVIAWVMNSLHLNPYLNPLVACGVLLTVFVNVRVALIISLPGGLLLSLFPGHGSLDTLVALLGAAIAIYTVSRVRQRYDLFRGGLFASLISAWVVMGLSLMNGLPWETWSVQAGSALLSGLGSSILVVGVLPVLEDIFGITTTFKLLELASPSQPLLRELQFKAPGTYHHSILVGNLAEAAAEAIGADALLVRVGSYYHDIGKTKRPSFFIENQLGMANQHDRISPRLSALVITAHVKEGLEMAREHKLPAIIQDFIATHHGTSLVSYFYHQAVQSEGPKQVQEEHFRYPGPRPRTRETGIVMLADGVEASCRTLKVPTPDQIESMVRKIIDKRLADGELSEAPLTLQEIEKIQMAFVRVLSGLFHQRIEYPEQIFKELRAGTDSESKGKKVGHSSK